MTGNTDPRVEAAAKVAYLSKNPEGDWENHTHIVKDVYRLQVAPLLHAADAADRAAGIVRVRVDDSEESDYEILRDAITEHLNPVEDDVAEVAILVSAIERAADALAKFTSPDDETVERVTRVLSQTERQMHTNESLGKQRMQARAVLAALRGESA